MCNNPSVPAREIIPCSRSPARRTRATQRFALLVPPPALAIRNGDWFGVTLAFPQLLQHPPGPGGEVPPATLLSEIH